MNNDPNMYTPAPVNGKKTWAIWSLVLSIMSVTVCCGGLIPAILGVVFANKSVNEGEDAAGMAKAGKIIGIIGIVLGVICIVGGIIAGITGGLATFTELMYY